MAFDIENFPTSESAKRMLGMVTKGYYDRSYVAKWLYQVMGLETDETRRIISELFAQIFPETATWALRYHEEKWGLPVYDEDSGETIDEDERERRYKERRRRIIEKRDCVAPMTPYRMEGYVQGLLDGYTARVADIHDPGEYGWTAPHPNVFRVYLIGDEDSGTADTKAVHRALRMIKQSHTTYTLEQRTVIIIDESGLEEVRLLNIRFEMTMPFWGCRVLGGDWRLDGSAALRSIRRYGLGLGINALIRIHEPEQSAEFPWIGFLIKATFPERYSMKVSHSMAIPFWGARTLNGDWLLDGGILLDLARRYGLGLAVWHALRARNGPEQIEIPNAAFRTGTETTESLKIRITHWFAAPFWGYFVLNGDWLLDGSVLLSDRGETAMEMDGAWLLDGKRWMRGARRLMRTSLQTKAKADSAGMESFDGFTVETHTKDYWFLDGALSLDGARNMNSIYRKETD